MEFTAEQARKLTKLYIDVYEGIDSDNPPVTLRIDRLEGKVTSLQQFNTEKKNTRNTQMTLALAGIYSCLGAIVAYWITHH